jgi:hypothetical protein
VYARLFPRSALLIFVITILSACGAAAGTTASTDTPDLAAALPMATAPAVVGSPMIASEQAKATPSTQARADKSSAPAAPGVTASASALGAVVYGISDPDLLGLSASAQVQELEQMKSIGATSVRVDASWYWGQPTKSGGFAWAPLDQVMASLQKVGLSADLDINQSPSWAGVASADGSAWAQPASPAAFATWAGAVAARYGPEGAKYFEIWNEPNLQGSWEPAPDPAAYTADLIAAYAAIKKVDPSAIVISGGLAPAANTPTSYDPRAFLEDMYTDGAQGSFDGLGDHPYSYPATPDEVERWSGWSLMSQTSPSLRSIMAENGDSAKKIWITEYGAPTSGTSSVGESGQSTDLVQAIAQVKALRWIGSFYIYTWIDDPTTASEGFGLLNRDNTEKSAYTAVADALLGGG